jgi:hypothetical protein
MDSPMDKQNVVCTGNRIAFCLKQAENGDTASTGMHLENTVPSEISQFQKD